MINKNELRIGNYVNGELYETGCSVTVRQYKIKSLGEKIAVLQDRKTQSVLSYQDIQPIPLTSEWLLKFGCKYSENYKGWQVLYSSGLRLIDYAQCRQVFIDSSTHTELRYVHQFQNFIYALTGEELTIQE